MDKSSYRGAMLSIDFDCDELRAQRGKKFLRKVNRCRLFVWDGPALEEANFHRSVDRDQRAPPVRALVFRHRRAEARLAKRRS